MLEGVLEGDWVGYALAAMLIGLVSAAIADRKNRSQTGFFLLGCFLPILGIVFAIIAAPGVPEGRRPVSCPRCNVRQNIPNADTEYECWQCKERAVPARRGWKGGSVI